MWLWFTVLFANFAEAIAEDCDALIGRVDAIAAVGQAIERGARWLRPKRIGIGAVSLDGLVRDHANELLRVADVRLIRARIRDLGIEPVPS